MSIDYFLIGSRIKELRTIQDLSQEELADLTNLSPTHISRIERGTKHASLETLLTIADVLGVTMNDLLLGNQWLSAYDFQIDVSILLSDCSATEKHLLLDILNAAKKALRENNWKVSKKNSNLK